MRILPPTTSQAASWTTWTSTHQSKIRTSKAIISYRNETESRWILSRFPKIFEAPLNILRRWNKVHIISSNTHHNFHLSLLPTTSFGLLLFLQLLTTGFQFFSIVLSILRLNWSRLTPSTISSSLTARIQIASNYSLEYLAKLLDTPSKQFKRWREVPSHFPCEKQYTRHPAQNCQHSTIQTWKGWKDEPFHL